MYFETNLEFDDLGCHHIVKDKLNSKLFIYYRYFTVELVPSFFSASPLELDHYDQHCYPLSNFSQSQQSLIKTIIEHKESKLLQETINKTK